MPRDRPTPDHQYLSIAHGRPPVTLCVCRECQEIQPSQPLRRRFTSRLNTCLAGARECLARTPLGTPAEEEHHDFYDTKHLKHAITIRPGIGKGEVERAVRGAEDWTTDWEWTLSVRYWDPDARCPVDGTFYFNDLPRCLRMVVPWQDESRTKTHPSDEGPSFYGSWGAGAGGWKHSWTFSENARYPRWCGKVSISRETMEEPGDVDPWAFLTASTSYM